MTSPHYGIEIPQKAVRRKTTVINAFEYRIFEIDNDKTMNQFIKRIIMSIAGVAICGISVGMFRFASLGVDPYQSLLSGIERVIPIRFGTLNLIVNAAFLLFSLIFDRKKIGIATFINLFLIGYIVEFSQGICVRLIPEPTLLVRIIFLLVGIVILCLSSALYYTADLGVSTYDAVALIWSEKQRRIPFPYCRIICDLICVTIGTTLCLMTGMTVLQTFGVVGVGTIITAFFMGPLIQFFNTHVAQPILYGRKHQDD